MQTVQGKRNKFQKSTRKTKLYNKGNMSNIYIIVLIKDFIFNCNFGINPDKALEKLIMV